MDTVELRGIRVVGTHGVLAEERDRAQPFEVDLDIGLDLSGAGRSDDLADTVDYGEIVGAVEKIVAGEHCALLERLAELIASEVLADARVAEVTVAVRKLRPPVPVDMATAGCADPSVPLKRRAFIGLGSNLGDRRALLKGAVDGLPDVVAVSPVYETDPVGGPEQGPYLNCVVELSTELSSRGLLAIVRRLERDAGRVRTERWGPRTLDVDILMVGDEHLAEPDLVVPHPRMWERSFVLIPLADIAPDLVDGGPPSDPGVRPAGTIDQGGES